jgi:predicted Zn-dependent peptidase
LTPGTQGIEPLLLGASEYGTANYPGAAARSSWARTGSQLLISPDDDWTLFGFRGIRQEFDSSWNVFADRVMHPTLAEHDIALVRSQMTGAIRQRRSDPDGYVMMVADSIAFPGHPYSLQVSGTEASLAALTSAPNKVMPLIRKQMDELRNLAPDAFSIRYFTDQFILDYFAENMTSTAQADFLARAQLYRGDYRQAGKSMEELRDISIGELRAASRRYFRNVHFVYLGDTTRVTRSSFDDF